MHVLPWALLNHPNIAYVLSAGTPDADRPYFGMESVKGAPPIQRRDPPKLTIEERLGLFLAVCETAQQAHQKAVIHRKITPSNILVACEHKQAISSHNRSVPFNSVGWLVQSAPYTVTA